MSASLLVDLGNTVQMFNSINAATAGSGIAYATSGALVGQPMDGLACNTFCNLVVAGTAVFGSGQLRVRIQTSDTDTSGSYTDPTSGLAQMPTPFSSGGVLIINSGALGGGVLGAFTSGQAVQSGFVTAAGFQRPHRYARAIVMSGDFYAGPLMVGFMSQLKVTGSGGGSTQSPGSGTPFV